MGKGNIIQQLELRKYTKDCSIGKLYPVIETLEGEGVRKRVKSFLEVIPKQGDVIILTEDVRVTRLGQDGSEASQLKFSIF